MKTYLMGVTEGPFALFETETFHRHLSNFSRIYLLVGLLEKSLQTVVPPILSSHSQLHGLANWYDALQLSQKGENSLRTAIKKAEQSRLRRESIPFEGYLPLSFWRYLVTRNNYGTLWVPILFETFPNLSNSKRLSTFKELDRRLGHAVKARNQIAHFEFRDGQNLDISIQNLLWLLGTLDRGLRIIGERLIADT